MEKWTEIRTAYRLAKLGTLSATAKELGIHRSTVMRHIDALEESLGITLFQRNDKGYLPTEAGLEVMRLGELADHQFSQFANRSRSLGGALEGTLSITCVDEVAQLLFPAIATYQSLYPKMKVEIIGDLRKFDLEYGEADIAIRTGTKPQTPDNIALPFITIEVVMCANQQYIARHGMPTIRNITEHQFLALNNRESHLPWNEWIYQQIPAERIAVTATAPRILNYGLASGCGIGISTKHQVQARADLVEIDVGETWKVETWILVHRDMVKVPKIRKFIDLLKEQKIPEFTLADQ